MNKLLTILHSSIDLFQQHDSDLLQFEIHEQSISHRIAYYIEKIIRERCPEFSDYVVDVEYNKTYIGTDKEVYGKCSACQNTNCYIQSASNVFNLLKRQEGRSHPDNPLTPKQFVLHSDKERTCRPDIVIHKRGKRDNKFAIELKINDDEHKLAKDKIKLSYLTCDNAYGYTLGALVNISDTSISYVYFQNGQEKQDLRDE